jgi:integrase
MGTMYKRGRKYVVQWRDASGKQRTLTLPDRDTAKAVLAEKVRFASMSRHAPSVVREERLSMWSALPVNEHMEAYEKLMKARTSTKQHVDQIIAYVRRVVGNTGAAMIGDITRSSVEVAIANIVAKGRVVKAVQVPYRVGTANRLKRAMKMFTAWLVMDGRLIEDPLRGLKLSNAARDRAYTRWPWTPDEHRVLLTSTRTGPVRYGRHGDLRAVLYWFAAATGLRPGTIDKLTVGSFDVALPDGVVSVAADQMKTGQAQTFVLPQDLTRELRRLFAGHDDAYRPFRLPDKAEKMIRADLAAAGLSVGDGRGRVRDFATLRHCFGTWHANAGTPPKVLKQLMGHTDVNTTMRYYTHTYRDDEVAAAARLPSFAALLESTAQATKRTIETQGHVRVAMAGIMHITGGFQGLSGEVGNAAGRIRTSNPLIRSPILRLTGITGKRRNKQISSSGSTR